MALAGATAQGPGKVTVTVDASGRPPPPSPRGVPLPFELKTSHAGDSNAVREHPDPVGGSKRCSDGLTIHGCAKDESIWDSHHTPVVSPPLPSHSRERTGLAQVPEPPSHISQRTAGAARFVREDSDTGHAWMLANIPCSLRVRDILDLLKLFGIGMAQATVKIPKRNMGYCFVLFFDKADAMRFAEQAEGFCFPKSTKRLIIRPTPMQDIRNYAVPVRRAGDQVAMIVPGRREVFAKVRL